MTRIIIVGAKGRMGQALLTCVPRFAEVKIAAAIDLGDNLKSALPLGDVVIDFSFHAATPGVAELCSDHAKGLVIGTTGHTADEQAQITACQTRIPIVWSANYSTGVNLLFWLSGRAAEILGPDFDLEIVEMHHRLKKDAPSGTAAKLAEILASVRKQQLSTIARHGRHGLVGERTPQEIGIHAVRGGDVVGDHTVIFAANGERVELTHRASNRETFAMGALRAALWLRQQSPGLYDMQDVLGLR